MKSSLGLFAALNLLGAVQAILFALAVVGLKRGNRVANLVLASLMGTLAILLVGSLLLHTKFILAFPHLAQIHAPFQFLVGPLFFIYIKALTSGPPKVSKRELLPHFIPFGLCTLYLIPFYFQGGEEKIYYLSAALQHYPREWYVRQALLLLQSLIYMIFTLITFIQYSRLTKKQSSAFEKTQLSWMRYVVSTAIVLWLVMGVRSAINYSLETIMLAPFFLTAFIYTSGYLGLRRPEILSGIEAPLPRKRNERSILSSDEAEEYLMKLSQLMENQKLYRDGNLTLEKLAQKIPTSSHHLSRILNELLKQSFAAFVNAYRIEEAKKRLADPRNNHYTIVAIAEASGFNSKSVFNTAFKKHTGLTPSRFRSSNSC